VTFVLGARRSIDLSRRGQTVGRDPERGLIPLNALITITHLPAEPVVTFYNESERLVRFLAATDKRTFLALLDAVARHQPLETILSRASTPVDSPIYRFWRNNFAITPQKKLLCSRRPMTSICRDGKSEGGRACISNLRRGRFG
jgi:hypothetical protein